MVFLLLLLLCACEVPESIVTIDQPAIEFDLLYDVPEQALSFNKEVLPVLEKRCVVCHGCYDAPCQLKLSSAQGVYRGINKKKVYDGTRVTATEPTRLFIDATSTAEWRQKDFHSILAENNPDNNPVQNLQDSVLYKVLQLKQLYPQARTGLLNDNLDLSLNRKQSCPTVNEFDVYAAEHVLAGMPYGMPNLEKSEYKTLVHWLAQGAPVEKDLLPSVAAAAQIRQWEKFLNGPSKKEKLVSRYLYEHLFQANIHFENTGNREFYHLVRSSTPPAEAVKIIATRRPYNAAGTEVYYRLLRKQGSIVAKQHIVYELSAQRMQRYQELFYELDYAVTELPSYQPEVASNPIKAFAAIPVNSRYRFLLDEARFFIEGFIKGPVCRGQVALSVIEDQFWVVFFDPDAPTYSLDDDFLKNNADKLAIPAELGNTFNLLSVELHYKKLFQEYIQQREKDVLNFKAIELPDAMAFIWDGDGKTNKNAALTIFRHLDSASVNFGLLGDYPETAWVIDYSVLERIHYLLVAGFDVYGNAGHQLNTRLYMDFLRTEGENYFLAFLPVKTRHELIQQWYQGLRELNKDDQGDVYWLDKELVKGYKTGNAQRELYQHIENHLGEIAGSGDYINRCSDDNCLRSADKKQLRADTAMKQVAQFNGEIIPYLSDIAFVRVVMGGLPENDLAYTMIYNKAYKSVSSFLLPDELAKYRDYHFDTLTVLPWLEGSYPGFFYVVPLAQIEDFVRQYNAIENHEHYEAFVMRFGMRRTNEDFWRHADWFNAQYQREQPLLSGIFDLNRYQNR